jgi:sec-independent protein translocase protein TatB
MFNIGGGEFLVIAVIALIVLGPQRLPEAARQVGKVIGDLRRVSSGFQAELKGALDEADRDVDAAPPRDVLGQAAGTEPPPAPRP